MERRWRDLLIPAAARQRLNNLLSVNGIHRGRRRTLCLYTLQRSSLRYAQTGTHTAAHSERARHGLKQALEEANGTGPLLFRDSCDNRFRKSHRN